MQEENKAGVKVEGAIITITDRAKFQEQVERMKERGRRVLRENYDFKSVFTDEEKAQKAQQLARACKEKNETEDNKKSVMADFKAKIDSKSAEINLLSTHIGNGYEYLTKTCDVIKDFDRGVKDYYHEGVHVGTEKLKAIDYQEVIEFVELNEDAAEEVKEEEEAAE